MGALLCLAHAHRQQRCGAIESLDLRFFIDTQHDGVIRRCQVEADDIGDFRVQLRVGGELKCFGLPRLDSVLAPSSGDSRVADFEVFAQQARGLVCDAVFLRWRDQCGGDDVEVIELLRSARAWAIAESGDVCFDVACSPLQNGHH